MQHNLPHYVTLFWCKHFMFCLFFGFWVLPPLIHAQPRLVKDISPNQAISEPIGSNLSDFVTVNGIMYFISDDAIHGKTLWKTDGTVQGTVKVAPGKVFNVQRIIQSNNILYFVSQMGNNNINKLWKTDGTLDGTSEVAPNKTINVMPYNMLDVAGTLYFSVFNGSDGTIEVWKTKGTTQETVRLISGLRGFIPALAKVNNTLYFHYRDNQEGIDQLWKSDGTEAGTVKVASGWKNGLGNFASYNNLLFFTAYDVDAGRNYFWKSDGTEAGTVRLAPDKIKGTFNPIEALGYLFFVDTENYELWKTDGTDEGTVKVGAGKFVNIDVFNFISVNNALYFIARDNAYTHPEIWKTDGTDEGTIKLAPNKKAYYANEFVAMGNTLFFKANDLSTGEELWKSDGTEAGTTLIKDIFPGYKSSSPSSLVNVNGTLIFKTYDYEKKVSELWKSNGTAETTQIINPGRLSSYPSKLTAVNNTLFFKAYNPSTGEELWKSDGTEAGTTLIKDITPGPNSSSFVKFTAANNLLFFIMNENNYTPQLWKSDGTEEGTVRVAPDILSNAQDITSINNTVFFASNGTLWKTDGTNSGTVQLSQIIQNPSNLTNVNGILYYTAFSNQNFGIELWKSDGTVQGTTFISQLELNSGQNSIYNFVAAGNQLFFTINSFASGYSQLWKSDGTSEGTVRIKDIYFGNSQYYRMNPLNVNGTLYFSARSESSYFFELWKSDGTETGTVSVAPGKVLEPASLTNFNNVLYFKGLDFVHGWQIWKSDGTEVGTVKITNGKVYLNQPVTPLFIPFPSLVSINNALFFSGFMAVGEELWQTDGTNEGTVFVKDIYTGSGSAAPDEFINVNGRLFFVAEDGVTGRELWTYDPSLCTSVNISSISTSVNTACIGTNTTLTINNSQAGVSYKALLNGQFPFGQSVMGGGNIVLSLPTAKLSAGKYNVVIYASGCTEQQIPGIINININASPEPPAVAPVTIYAGEQATLTVTGAPVGTSFKWYTQSSGGTAIPGANLATFVTPALTASATYYVALVSDCGETERTAVTVTMIGNPCTASGTILREVWEEVPGNTLSLVPFYAAPSLQSQLTIFEAPSNMGSNYGQRIRGYICPPQTGNYTFWISGDDNCELWLSANDDPATKTRIAHITGNNAWTGVRIWNRFASQQSAPIYLQAGQKYYIEALHKEGIGSDNLAVGWQLPDNTLERPIAGTRLSPYVPFGKGTLLKETWANVKGNTVDKIPLQLNATTVQEITSFEAPANIANNYGQRIRGYVHPPVSGEYTFYISGDDNCELWLSTDEDPANKSRIAQISGTNAWTYPKQWNRFASQKSAKVTLVAGRKYYVEVLHKEGIGSDHVAVGWQFPDLSLERPIPGIRLSPFAFDGQERIGVEQQAQTHSLALEVYPNPSQGDKIFIRSKGFGTDEKVEVLLYNAVGGVIATQSYQADESGGVFEEMAFSGKLPAGIYTIMLQSSTHSITRKLVVTR